MQQKNNMTIHFMDGSTVSYDFPKQVDNNAAIATRLSKLLEMQYVIVESDGALQFYPVNNIKSIQVYPLPEVFPDYIIRGACML